MKKHHDENFFKYERVLIFRHNIWPAAYDVIWSESTKLSGSRAFRPIVMAAVAVTVVIAPFFATIIIATRYGSLDDSDGSLDGSNGSLSGSLVGWDC